MGLTTGQRDCAACDYCSDFRHFAFGGLGTTYNVHVGLIGKRVVDFLLVLIELFC